MRKSIALLLIFTFLFSYLPVASNAVDGYQNKNIIVFEDGSYIVIQMDELSSRAASTKSGSKTYNYYDASDNLEWQAKLSASFTYDGVTSSCTSASCTVTTYDSKWYEISNSTTRSGNTATTALTMGKKFLGITVSKPEYTLTLTCDKDGNLS